jgi:hypothetical protein
VMLFLLLPFFLHGLVGCWCLVGCSLSVSSLRGNHDGWCCGWYIFKVSKILIRDSFRSPFEFNYDAWCCCLDGCCLMYRSQKNA